MALFAYSVLTRWFSSVYSGAGKEPCLDQMAKQVVTASSVTSKDVNDRFTSWYTTYDIPMNPGPYVSQPTDRRGRKTRKVIIVPVETANTVTITGKAHSAFVITRLEEELEKSLILNLDKEPENCILCKPKVVVIQTAHGSTMMNSTQCYKSCYVCNRLVEVWPILMVKHTW
jgi:hypothetical protein